MGGVSVFGKPASSSIASAVLDAPSLNQAPSPSQPEHAPADGLSKLYAQLFAIASSALQVEQDIGKLQQLQSIITFADSALAESAQSMGSGGAPVPNYPGAAPQPQVAPQAAMGAPNPVAPSSPTPGAPAA